MNKNFMSCEINYILWICTPYIFSLNLLSGMTYFSSQLKFLLLSSRKCELVALVEVVRCIELRKGIIWWQEVYASNKLGQKQHAKMG